MHRRNVSRVTIQWETDSIRKEEIAMFSLKCTKQIKGTSCNGECVPEMPFPGGFPCSGMMALVIVVSYRCRKCNATFSVMERFHAYPLADLDPAYDGFSCYFGKSVTESRFDVMKLKASINALSMHVADSNSELLSQRITLLRYYLFSEVGLVGRWESRTTRRRWNSVSFCCRSLWTSMDAVWR